MSEKKNIDKLFKEKFKNFEATPEDFIWENIETNLHEEKRKSRRVIPFWWKVAGIAAGIILLFTVAQQVFTSTSKNGISKDVIVDDSDNSNKNNAPKYQDKDFNQNTNSDVVPDNATKSHIVDNEQDSKSAINADKKATESQYQNNQISQGDSVNSTITSENLNTTNQNNTSSTKSNSNRNVIKEFLKENEELEQKPASKNKYAVANETTAKTSSETSNNNQEEVLKNTSEIDNILKSKSTTVADATIKQDVVSETENNSTEDVKVPETEQTNAIEDAIAEAEQNNEKEEEENEKLNRWSVSPNVAPVYFGSFGEGSPLDNQFVENSKESEINMSYGVNGSYAVNKKLKIRAGINKVQLGQKTNDVLIFANTNPIARGTRQIANVNLADSMSQHSIYSARNFKFDNAPATLFTQEQGSIDQQLGFIEVPLEIEYNVVEKKIGLNFIGGFSALFLSDNDVYAVLNNGDRTRLGEASNVKDLSYTANFGIGLDYNFSEQFQFNLEPTFKYQINTFNNTSGDFNPFFVGLYTGLSFKF